MRCTGAGPDLGTPGTPSGSRMRAPMHQYIGGQRRDAASGDTFDVIDRSTNQTLETVTLAGHADVHALRSQQLTLQVQK